MQNDLQNASISIKVSRLLGNIFSTEISGFLVVRSLFMLIGDIKADPFNDIDFYKSVLE